MYAMGYYKRQILRPQRQAGMCNPIVDKRRAKVFDERFNADEFLRSLPKAMKNLGYYVAPEDAGAEMRSITAYQRNATPAVSPQGAA